MKQRFETFTVLINRISRNIRRIKNQEMAEYNLRSSHISCLYYLYLAEGLTATDLCERCEEDKATISRCLDYLETKPVSFHGVPEIPKAQELAEISVGLTEEERVAFYRSLSIISDSLETVAKKFCK